MLTSSRGPDANDRTISRTEEEIGRLYEDDTASRPENRWFWSITVMGPARHQVRTDGRAPALEQAKADFRPPGPIQGRNHPHANE
jgi:hypothetical protein